MIAIREQLALPTRTVSKLISTLVAAGVLNEVRCEEEEYDVAYAPARDITALRVSDVLEAVDNYADGPTEQLCHAAEARRAEECIEALKLKLREADSNELVINLINE